MLVKPVEYAVVVVGFEVLIEYNFSSKVTSDSAFYPSWDGKMSTVTAD